MSLFGKLGKKRIRNDESDDEEEINHSGVFMSGDKIYFTGPVSAKSINVLSQLIEMKNQEFSMLAGSGLLKHAEPKPILLCIHSGGGDAVAGLRAVDLIQSSKIPIYTIATGIAASAAAFMLVAGKRRFMTKNAYVLIHQIRLYGIGGKYHDVVDEYSNASQMMKQAVDHFTDNTKLLKKQVTDLLRHEKMLNLQWCIKNGIVDDEWKNEDTLRSLEDSPEMEIDEEELKKGLAMALLGNLEPETKKRTRNSSTDQEETIAQRVKRRKVQ